MNKTLLSTILIISLFQKFDFHNSTLQQEDNSVYLLAPVTAGQTLTINHGYNDPLPYDISQIKCQIGTPPDHCDNQKYGLDLVPSNLSDLRILAPLPGKIAWITGECLGILTKDNLNLNICHFQNYSVAEQVDISRGDVLGTRIAAKEWIHLSLDDANYGGIRQPIPFNGAHTIEGISFDPGPDTKRGPTFNNILITSTNAQTGIVPSQEMNWWESIWQNVKNAWNDFWGSISTGGIIYAKERKEEMVTETVSPTDIITPELSYAGITTRVSVPSNGTQGNGESHYPSISADGRYVAFESDASNLVKGDTNGYADIFVHDRRNGQTDRTSVASDGTQGNGDCFSPSISADGRYVAFYSDASNLVSGDTNGYADIFVHDRENGQTTLISVTPDGMPGNGESNFPSISDEGRYVAFNSYASNLVNSDMNNNADIFVYDRQSSQTALVSVASDGTQGNGQSNYAFLSADGRYVTFDSFATNLVSGDTNGFDDVFIHDRQTGQTMCASVTSDGAQWNNDSWDPSVSADGRYVTFTSYDINDIENVYVHDMISRQTILVSVSYDGTKNNGDSRGAVISKDGRYVAFFSGSGNLVNGDTNGAYDIFVRHFLTGQTTRVSVSSNGLQVGLDSYNPSISADGRFVAFDSRANDLVSGDYGYEDVFVH